MIGEAFRVGSVNSTPFVFLKDTFTGEFLCVGDVGKGHLLQRNFTMGYLETLRLATAETNRLRYEKANAKLAPADPRIVCEIPLKTQVQQYLLSQPPNMRDKPISLMALRAQLQGRYNANSSVGNLGIVLKE